MLKVKEANKIAWQEVVFMAEDCCERLDRMNLRDTDKKKRIKAYQNVIKVAQKKVAQYAN